MSQYAKRLGNLVLLNASSNSASKSSTFQDKKQMYAASPYVLTSQVAQADSWTPETIVERQKSLAQLAVKAWPAS